MQGFEVFSPAYYLEVTTITSLPETALVCVCVSVGVQGGGRGAVSTLVSVDSAVSVPPALLALVHRRGEPLRSHQLSWTHPPRPRPPSSCKAASVDLPKHLPTWQWDFRDCFPPCLSLAISSSLLLPGSPQPDQPGLGDPWAGPEEQRRWGSAHAQGCGMPTPCLPTFTGSVWPWQIITCHKACFLSRGAVKQQ